MQDATRKTGPTADANAGEHAHARDEVDAGSAGIEASVEAGGEAGVGADAATDVESDPASTAPPSPTKAGAYPRAVDRMIGLLAQLPGIGRKSAERLAFHIIKSSREDALALASAIRDAKVRVRNCALCWNLCDADVCDICADPRRDRSVVLVVEQPKDLISLEQSGMFKGVYHVLMGRLSPLDGVGPGDLTIAALLERVRDASKNCGGVPVREVVLGLNPTVEGDGTAVYLGEKVASIRVDVRAGGAGGAGGGGGGAGGGRAGERVRVTRLARGVPTGAQLEYVNKAVLADAIMSRQPMKP